MKIQLEKKFVDLSGSTEEKVAEFIKDINTLLDLGMWWSDACEVLWALKDYGFNTQGDSWGEFLDICVGVYCVSKTETVTDSPIFF